MVQLGLLFWDLEHGRGRRCASCRELVAELPAASGASSRRDERAARPVRAREYHSPPAAIALLVGFGAARNTSSSRLRRCASALPAAVRVRHPDPLRRAAADVRRGQPLGRIRYEKALYLADLTDERSTFCRADRGAQSVAALMVLLYLLDGAYCRRRRGRHRVRRAAHAVLGHVRPRAIHHTEDIWTRIVDWVRDTWEWLRSVLAAASGSVRQLHGRCPTTTECAGLRSGASTSGLRTSRRPTTRTTCSASTRTSPRPRVSSCDARRSSATLGPASIDHIRARRGRAGRRPAQHVARHARRARGPTRTCARPPTRSGTASASWSTCRVRRSGSARSPTGGACWRTAPSFTISTDATCRRRAASACPLRPAAGRRQATGCWSTTATSCSR